jgi:hypothetical protein
LLFWTSESGLDSRTRNFQLPAITVIAPGRPLPAGFVHCLIYPELAAFKFMTIGARNSGTGLFVSTHFDKTKTFGVAGFTILNDLGGSYTAKARK